MLSTSRTKFDYEIDCWGGFSWDVLSEVQIVSESVSESEYKAFKILVSEFERMSEVASVSAFFLTEKV